MFNIINDDPDSDMKRILLLNQSLPIKSELIHFCRKCNRVINEKYLKNHFTIYSTVNLYVCQANSVDLI
jgi:hypothetical protein